MRREGALEALSSILGLFQAMSPTSTPGPVEGIRRHPLWDGHALAVLAVLTGLLIVGVGPSLAVGNGSKERPATQTSLPHLVRVLLRPEAAVRLREAFAERRSVQPDLQRIILDSTALIAQVLELPLSLTRPSTAAGPGPALAPLRIRPFMPEHSIVLRTCVST